MRGPGYRIAGDVRRTWRCPNCGTERKLPGDATTLMCRCRENSWMQIVVERTMAPRPLQRPSDVERHPIDFGIEPPPPAPPRQEATIVKSALSDESDVKNFEVSETESNSTNVETKDVTGDEEDTWGEGIL